MQNPPSLSVIIPACNEEGWIADCLASVFASDPVAGGAEAVVVANGCTDRTAQKAREVPVPEGWRLTVVETEIGSKPKALTLGDQVARGGIRAYLDADCRLSPPLLAELAALLGAIEGPAYASGTPHIPQARHWVSRAYARFWQKLPFLRSVAPGFGLYAVNRAGRAFWGDFPDLIADDSFVRLQFLPEQRHQLAACYDWPVVEGFGALVRVRRRQDRGLRQLQDHAPHLMARDARPPHGRRDLARLALGDPLGFCAYAAVLFAGRFGSAGQGFTRGR